MTERDAPSPAATHELRPVPPPPHITRATPRAAPTTIDGFIERIRATQPDASAPSLLVFTTASKDFFHGELLDTSPDSLLLRQADGVEVLILRAHIVAITAAAS